MMMYLVENAEPVRAHVWSAKVQPRYFDHLRDGLTPVGPYTVISAQLAVENGQIIFSPDNADLLCRGVTEDALFIDNRAIPEYSDAPEDVGDEAFIHACQQLVGDEFAKLAGTLVEGIRAEHSGRLAERQNRKWLNEPDNFVAVTIQNRDRTLAISIRNVEEAVGSHLHPKPDRPGYLRFKVSNESDLPEALRLITASGRR